MRYLATSDFLDKVKTLATQALAKHELQKLLDTIQAADKIEIVSIGTLLNDEVYVVAHGSLRLFLSFGSDESGEYALLLDIASQRPTPAPAQPIPNRNPAHNLTINPNYNTALNPNYNTALNPNYNTKLNPNYNTTLNPNYNTTLNPNYNTTLNPNYNTTLNPNYNTALNPNYNRTLNPNYNAAHDGPFFYALDARRIGFCVRVNERVLLRFDNNAKYVGTAIARGDGGFNVHDTNGKWLSYLVPSGQGGFLEFDTSGKWIGFFF
jgi:hypothetical protein